MDRNVKMEMLVFLLLLTLGHFVDLTVAAVTQNGYREPIEEQQSFGNETENMEEHQVQYIDGVDDELLCNKTQSSTEIYLRSVNYPAPYGSNVNCTYTIQKASVDVCELEFKVLHFETEDGPSCNYDYLAINQDRFCGSIPANTTKIVPFNDTEMILKFYSNERLVDTGFEIMIVQKTNCSLPSKDKSVQNCSREISSELFFINSPNYPEYYNHNMNCNYTLKKFSSACKLQLTFVDFHLENSTNCNYDYLEINGTKYCGKGPGRDIWIKFQGEKIQETITFHSDNTVSYHGFYIVGQQFRTGCTKNSTTKIGEDYCNEEKSSEIFFLRSPHYPGNYSDYMDCIYRIRKFSPLVCELRLSFVMLHLEKHDICGYDYFEVYGKRYCGNKGPDGIQRFKFKDQEMNITFHSDSSNTYRGFYVIGHQVTDCERRCIE